MRTESRKYSTPFLKDIHQYIRERWTPEHIGDFTKIENQDGKNPHEAIRVTQLHVSELDNTEYQGKIATLYKFIWRTTLQSCMSDAKIQLVDVMISSPLEKVSYKNIVEIPIFLGWKCVVGVGSQNENNTTTLENLGKGLLFYFESLIAAKQPIQFQKITSSLVFHHKHSHYSESGLIKQLEDFGIGRPSTFAMFIETIQERGYVKKMDVEGTKLLCDEYELIGSNITKIVREKIMGNEKDKLIIQPIGKVVIEFLIQYFNHVFSYNYTKQLEELLDEISFSEEDVEDTWYVPCEECDSELKKALQPLSVISKKKYPIKGYDDNECTYFVQFTKFGPTIIVDRKESKDDEPTFLPIKKEINLDIHRLEQGGYTLEDLLDTPTKNIGKWGSVDVFLKNGRYGYYLEFGEQKISCNMIKKPIEEITIQDIPMLLQQTAEKKNDPNILRVLNEHMSVRKGKFGAYVYYKTPSMPKPSFFNIKRFGLGFSTCEKETLIHWIDETYFSGKK